MIKLHRSINPPVFFIESNKIFLRELEIRKLTSVSQCNKLIKDLIDDENTEFISYNSRIVKENLLNLSSKRCPFCTKMLELEDGNVDILKYNDSFKYSVEHIIPRSHNIKLIMEFENLVASCDDCNGCRGNEYNKDLYLNLYDCEELDSFTSFEAKDGELILYACSSDLYENINYMIEMYELNRTSLATDRLLFFNTLLNGDFKKLRRFEIEENYKLQKSIIFLDVYEYNERRIANDL